MRLLVEVNRIIANSLNISVGDNLKKA